MDSQVPAGKGCSQEGPSHAMAKHVAKLGRLVEVRIGLCFLEDRSCLGRALGTAGCGGFFLDLVMIVRFLFESFKSMCVAKLKNT